MRSTALLWATLSLSSSAALADPADDIELDTARTVDLAGGLMVADPLAGQGRFRPGVALAARFYSDSHLYATGGMAVSVGATDGPSDTGMATTILTVTGGAGAWGERGDWTGYAGVRGELFKNLDWPERASLDPDWFTSGIGAGPSVALAKRIGFAWGHPMAIELEAGYMLYRLRRPETGLTSPVEPDPDTLDGLQIGLFVVGTLFPDRPL